MTRRADRDLASLPSRERQRIEARLVTLRNAYGLPNIRLDIRIYSPHHSY